MNAKLGWLNRQYPDEDSWHANSLWEFHTEKEDWRGGEWRRIVYFEIEDNE